MSLPPPARRRRAAEVPPLLARNGAPRARTPVEVAAVLRALCAHAIEGYREPYKREVIGLLLGRRARDGRLRCLRAVRYDARCRARTRCDPNPDALRRRARSLASRMGLRFLGCYHSHPEEAGSRAWALSADDRAIFRSEQASSLEVVVSVARTRRTGGRDGGAVRRNKDGSISLWLDGHHFRISAEAKADG